MFKQFPGVMLSLLLAVLAVMALPASAQTAKTQAPTPNAKAVAVGDVARPVSQAPDQEAKDQIKELAAELKSIQAAVLEEQRKSIDWWMTAIGIVLTFIGLLAAVLGILIPMYVNREKNRLLKAAQDEFARMNVEAKNILVTLKSHEKDGANSAAAGKTAFEEIEQLRLTMKAAAPGDIPNTSEPNSVAAKTFLAATEIEKSPLATKEDKLRARAILAGRKTPRSAEQAQTAYELWAALALLNEQDDSAHANAGYWAQVLYGLEAQPGAAYWLQATYKHYAQALSANPERHEVTNNWGIALAAEANALCVKDLPLAQAKWREAGEKYAQALDIKPKYYEAANNWGGALVAEADALCSKDLSKAQAKWREAEAKFAQALHVKPKAHEAAYNWGTALVDEAKALCGEDLPNAQAKWREAGEKFAQALRSKPDLCEAAANWGNALAAEAKALCVKDLPKAQAKWREAGEKYAQALRIKPADHEAAKSWGVCLYLEAYLLRAEPVPDEAAASRCLTQAVQLLEKQAARGKEGQEAVAITLARAYSMQSRANDALAQLEIARKANDLSADWQTSPTLQNLRATSEYQTWLNQHFPKKD